MGGQATVTLATMWAFVVIVFVFVGLRLYTRMHLIDSLGWDDHAYTAGSVLLLICTTFTQIAAHFGFGQDADTLPDNGAAKAQTWEIIGITVAFLAMAVAKWSFGLFLLRFVMGRWQRLAIWVIMSILLFLCVLTDILFWIECLPPESVYQQSIHGTCQTRIMPCLKATGMWGVFADIYLAIVPWVCIWTLTISKLEKMMIAGSMSLGILACLCGIVRNVKIEAFNEPNFIGSTTSFVVWTAAEVFVTLVCIGIPILRPLLVHFFPNFLVFTKSTHKKQSGDLDSEGAAVFATHTIGGGLMLREFPAEGSTGGGQTRGYRGTWGPNVRTEVSGRLGNLSDESVFQPIVGSSSTPVQKPKALVTRDDG